MKKSTLITTIAMIVVVVVALSTATYAWFSTSSQSIATTTITTQSNSDWTIQKGNFPATLATGTAQAITFASGGDNIELNGAMNEGLWSPSEAIALYTKNQNAVQNEVATNSLVTWFTAQKDNGSGKIWATGKYAPETGKAHTYRPDILRVVNSKRDSDSESAKNLLCNVVVSLGSAPSDGTKYAAAATVFYLGVNNGTTKAYTNGYGVPNEDMATITANPAYNSGSVVTPGTPVTATVTGKPNYADALTGLGDNWHKVGTPNELETQLNLAANTEYLLYTIDLGSVAYAQGVTIVLYTWLDGWVAGDEAVGSSLNIIYSFSTGTKTTTPAQGEAGSGQG